MGPAPLSRARDPQPQGGGPLTKESVRKDWEKYFYETHEIPKGLVEEAFRQNSRPGSKMVRETFRRNKWSSFYENLRLIKAPTLILVGSHSSLPLEDARAAQTQMNAELYVLERTRHGLHIEKADEFNKVVTDFLRK